jgi:membrane protease YdiL (CAAX protease family)
MAIAALRRLRPLRIPSWRYFAVAVLSGAALAYIVYLARWWLFLHRIGNPPALGRVTWTYLLLWATLSAIGEEIVFRGLVLKYLARVHWLLGLLVSSAAFAAIHTSPRRPVDYVYLVQVFVGGLWFGILYLRSRSVLVPIVAHLTFNIAARLCQLWMLGF